MLLISGSVVEVKKFTKATCLQDFPPAQFGVDTRAVATGLHFQMLGIYEDYSRLSCRVYKIPTQRNWVLTQTQSLQVPASECFGFK